MKTVAIIPVKPLEAALGRLALLLSAGERRALQTAMVADVLRACSACPLVDRTVVVSQDAAVGRLARSHSADVALDFDPPRGVNQAVAIGQRQAVALGADAALVLMSDLPLARASDVASIIGALQAGRSCCVLVPARSGTGTNAFAISPPDAIRPRFGVDSLQLHTDEIARVGMRATKLRLARVSLDVDTPADVLALIDSNDVGPSTRRVIRRIGGLPLRSGPPSRGWACGEPTPARRGGVDLVAQASAPQGPT